MVVPDGNGGSVVAVPDGNGGSVVAVPDGNGGGVALPAELRPPVLVDAPDDGGGGEQEPKSKVGMYLLVAAAVGFGGYLLLKKN